jgi:hypothetical protein
MAEVEEHKMGPPLEEVDAQSKYSNHYNIVQRYGIEQGVDELGSPKIPLHRQPFRRSEQ